MIFFTVDRNGDIRSVSSMKDEFCTCGRPFKPPKIVTHVGRGVWRIERTDMAPKYSIGESPERVSSVDLTY